MSSAIQQLPELVRLHERHDGLTDALAGTFAEAASVCLSRHHTPPKAVMVSADTPEDASYLTDWPPPTVGIRRAWANAVDATEAGAYGLTLAAAEAHLGLVALSRSEQGTGADYYIGRPGSGINPVDGELDLEEAFRLEISGIDRCDAEYILARRVREKVEQARAGVSSLPAFAGVVAFNMCRIVFQDV